MGIMIKKANEVLRNLKSESNNLNKTSQTNNGVAGVEDPLSRFSKILSEVFSDINNNTFPNIIEDQQNSSRSEGVSTNTNTQQEPEQQVQGSDQTQQPQQPQQPQQQNPAVDPQLQQILQPITDQLKVLIDSNNNSIQCIKQLQGIVSAQSADIYNLTNNLGTLTNRVNLIAAGYIEPFAKDLPDDVATGTSN